MSRSRHPKYPRGHTRCGLCADAIGAAARLRARLSDAIPAGLDGWEDDRWDESREWAWDPVREEVT